MERSITSISLRDHDLLYSLDDSEDTVADDHIHGEDCSENSRESTPENNSRASFTEAASSGLSCSKSQLGTDAVLVSIDGGLVKSSQHFLNGKDLQLEQPSPILQPPILKSHALPVRPSTICHYSNGMSVEIPPFDQADKDIDPSEHTTQQVSDLAWNLSDGIVCSPNPTGPRSLWHHNRFTSSSSSFGDLSHVWPDGKRCFIPNGFGNGPKKPRTQVHYTMPIGGLEHSSKHKNHNQNGLPYKRIRRANEKRTSDGSRGFQRNLELLACDVNLLITLGDKGWRDCGARVFLEGADQNEWRLSMKHGGITKYACKVLQDLQPGSSNRYTHAMIWKGGKDWALEFPDRSQWMLFKEMHQECYNRNIRAASIKNIPIPGVRLIEEFDDGTAGMPFVCTPTYFRQLETDVVMAMDTSRVLYDVDSEDEEWILRSRKSWQTEESRYETLSEELFEKAMDMFEKVSYTQQRDHFTVDEIDKLVVGVGPMEVISVIYEHWRQKRQKKGMALIRQLQPPLWEVYQQELKEWEQLITKSTTALSTGSQEKAPSVEKPPMFAFCLKPRGLEVLNKGSKHRPQRKISLSRHSHALFGDQDGLHSFGRRLNGFPHGDEKAIFPSNSHEFSDASPRLHPLTRIYSPRDAAASPGYFSLNNDAPEWNHHPKLHRNNSKKMSMLSSTSNLQMVASSSPRKTNKRNGVHRPSMALPDWPGQSHHQLDPHGLKIEQLGGSDLDEFRLRDASSAAKHARNMAKLKRERAQKLLYRADLAIHKAVSSLMTAEAIKASHEASNGDGRLA